jgi:hypothetical protein
LLAPRQSVEDHIGAGQAGVERFRAGCVDRSKTVRQHSRQNLHHLPVTVG